MNEKDLNSFMTSWATSKTAQLFNSKMNTLIEMTSQYIAMPVWFKGDWNPDQVFMVWDLNVIDPATYVAEFSSFTSKVEQKRKIAGSYGVGFSIIG